MAAPAPPHECLMFVDKCNVEKKNTVSHSRSRALHLQVQSVAPYYKLQ